MTESNGINNTIYDAVSNALENKINNCNTLLPSTTGKSAYDLAVDYGYAGTENMWLTTLQGLSAYEVAITNGYKGNKTEWLKYIKADGGIQAIQEFLTKPSNEQVDIPDYGNIPSLQGYISTMFENGGLPATPFKTKALLDVSTLADGDYATVTHDTVIKNNGLYVKTAGAWVKSEYTPVIRSEVIKTLENIADTAASKVVSIDSLFEHGNTDWGYTKYADLDKTGYYRKSTGTFVAYGLMRNTGLVRVFKGEMVEYGSYFREGTGSTSSVLNLYDENKKFIQVVEHVPEIWEDKLIEGVYEVPFNGFVALSTFPGGLGDSAYLKIERKNTLNSRMVTEEKRTNALELVTFKGDKREIVLDKEYYYRASDGAAIEYDEFRSADPFLVTEGSIIEVSLQARTGRTILAGMLDMNKENHIDLIDPPVEPYGIFEGTLRIPYDGYLILSSSTPKDGSSTHEAYVYITETYGKANGSVPDTSTAKFSNGGTCVVSPNATILMSGASFAAPVNGWFELMCGSLGVTGVNKAVGGHGITNLAVSLFNDTFYTQDLLNTAEALVIMHVWNFNINASKDITIEGVDYTDEQLSNWTAADYEATNWTRLTTPPTKSGVNDVILSALFDYCMKKLQQVFYGEKDNPNSVYYNTVWGKPFNVVLATSWHDARAAYNNSVRGFCSKWGCTLIEFDKNIGFSKEQLHSSGVQHSVLYAMNGTDKETIGVEEYAWHFERGQNVPIVRKMAGIAKSCFEII